MGESKDILLLEKFLAGTITPDEEVWLREWAETTLSRPSTLDLMLASWTSEKVPNPPLNREARWHSLRRRIMASAVVPQMEDVAHCDNTQPRAVARRSWRGALSTIPLVARVACFAAVLLGAVWMLTPHMLTLRGDSHRYTREYVTARGQRAVIRLPDGTMATLAPETRLQLSITEPIGARRIDLDGEAFFVVESNHTAPFIVRTGNTLTKVLGTGFGVRHYESDSIVRVAVASGRVAVQVLASNATPIGKFTLHDSRDVILNANEVVNVTASGTQEIQYDADVTTKLGWRTGHHVFRKVSAASVAAELGRAYDLDIRIPDSALARQLLTLSSSTARESAMLDILVSTLLDARMERRGRTVIISPITR